MVLPMVDLSAMRWAGSMVDPMVASTAQHWAVTLVDSTESSKAVLMEYKLVVLSADPMVDLKVLHSADWKAALWVELMEWWLVVSLAEY